MIGQTEYEDEIFYVVVPKNLAQFTRQSFEKEGIHAKGRNFTSFDDGRLGVPFRLPPGSDPESVVRCVLKCSETPHIISGELTTKQLPKLSKPEKVRQICTEHLRSRQSSTCQSDLSAEIPTHWEVHGDVCLLPQGSFESDTWRQNKADHELNSDEEHEVSLFRRVCRVLGVERLARKSVIANDDFRSPKVELLYGFSEDIGTWVRRTENSVIYSWDITRSMFSAGNITEKMRVAKFHCRGKTVVDLFAGIGYFTLPYLKHAEADHVYACEWNPAAVEALRDNLRINNIDPSRCTILEGDNRETCPKNVADFVNLGLIPSSKISYRTAVEALKKDTGGLLLIHGNVRSQRFHTFEVESFMKTTPFKMSCDIAIDNPSWLQWVYETAKEIWDLLEAVRGDDQKWQLRVNHLEKVKQFSPHVDHLVLDLNCLPIDPNDHE